MREHGMDLETLQFYIKMGVKLIDIHRVIRFSQKPYFKPFIEHCARKRRENLNDPVLNKCYKLLMNSLYGRTIMDVLKYNLDTKLVTEENINAEISHPRFHTITKVSDPCYLITKFKERVMLNAPIYIGCIVLQKAKLYNLKLHYTIVKPSANDFPSDPALDSLLDSKHHVIIKRSRQIIQSIQLVYGDTDSLCYHVVFRPEVKGITLDEVYKNTFLKPLLDRSNFKVLDKTCGFEGGSFGKLKLETQDEIPLEGYFLSSKVYSIKTLKRQQIDVDGGALALKTGDFGYKRAAKGCSRSKLDSFVSHDVYKAVYEGLRESPTVTSNRIRYSAAYATMVTMTTAITPLSLICPKRFWFDKDRSVGWGHERSYENGFRSGDVICVQGGQIVHPPDSEPVVDNGVNNMHENDISIDEDTFLVLFELSEGGARDAVQNDSELISQVYDNADGLDIVFRDDAVADDDPRVSSKRKRGDESHFSGHSPAKRDPRVVGNKQSP